jgi:prepilin-type N-terminal cleavage/methylation domain-containing protein
MSVPQRGFTLLELLLVLAIGALIASLSVVSVQSVLGYAQRKTDADRFETLVKMAPRQAVRRLCWARLRIDNDRRLMSVSACGQPLNEWTWAEDMEVVVTASLPSIPPSPSNRTNTVTDLWFSPKADAPAAVLALRVADQVLREVDLRPFAD